VRRRRLGSKFKSAERIGRGAKEIPLVRKLDGNPSGVVPARE
jgi:hypothetical protein